MIRKGVFLGTLPSFFFLAPRRILGAGPPSPHLGAFLLPLTYIEIEASEASDRANHPGEKTPMTDTPKESSRIHDAGRSTSKEIDYRRGVAAYFESSQGATIEKLENFTKYVPRQVLTRFITRFELVREVLEVQGSIVECGVYLGGGLMSLAQASAILEPLNYQRKVIGFDTFEGFPSTSDEDRTATSPHAKEGGLASHAEDDIREAIRLFDQNRFLNHIGKVDLVRGDVIQTIPRFLEDAPHTVVSLLYLDMDLYEPTRAALEAFLPRMPRGAVLAFDELNLENWPGETLAVMDAVGLHELEIRRFPFDPTLSYAVL